MAGRPEGSDGGYDAVDPVDPNAWEEFTAWRPSSGGAGSTHETDHGAWHGGAGPVDRGGYGWGAGRSRRSDGASNADSAATGAERGRPAEPERRGSWWTEEQPAVYNPGQRVESTQNTGGMFGGRTRAGTTGQVQGVTSSLTGHVEVEVRFDNGYTERVSPDEIKPKRWL